MIEEGNPLVQLESDEVMLRLVYSSSNTKEALMANLVKKFNVEFNIIFGNVEVLSNQPLGNLVIKVKGNKDDVNASINYVKEQGVKVEVLK
jgi:D-methionine transport system ATP-binding protein